MKDNIFLAFSSKKLTLSIGRMLISDGFKITSIAKNVVDFKNIFQYYHSGIIIMGYRFDGVHIDDLLEDMPKDFTVIFIGDKLQLDSCENENVFKLSVPLHKTDLICAVEMFTTIESTYKPIDEKNVEEHRIINRAKRILIDAYSMTEDQAHRYIQKKSMDTGKKLVDIARIILEI